MQLKVKKINAVVVRAGFEPGSNHGFAEKSTLVW
jgi:hypothetical protein